MKEIIEKSYESYYGFLGPDSGSKSRDLFDWIASRVYGNRVVTEGSGQGLLPIIFARMGKVIVGVDNDDALNEYAGNVVSRENPQISGRIIIHSSIGECDTKLIDGYDTFITLKKNILERDNNDELIPRLMGTSVKQIIAYFSMNTLHDDQLWTVLELNHFLLGSLRVVDYHVINEQGIVVEFSIGDISLVDNNKSKNLSALINSSIRKEVTNYQKALYDAQSMVERYKNEINNINNDNINLRENIEKSILDISNIIKYNSADNSFILKNIGDKIDKYGDLQGSYLKNTENGLKKIDGLQIESLNRLDHLTHIIVDNTKYFEKGIERIDKIDVNQRLDLKELGVIKDELVRISENGDLLSKQLNDLLKIEEKSNRSIRFEFDNLVSFMKNNEKTDLLINSYQKIIKDIELKFQREIKEEERLLQNYNKLLNRYNKLEIKYNSLMKHPLGKIINVSYIVYNKITGKFSKENKSG